MTDKTDEPNNPFPGPQPYQAKDGERFFGRDEIADSYASTMLVQRCVTLYGPSGSGKSSLMAARILPTAEKRRHRVVIADQWPDDESPVDRVVCKIGEMLPIDAPPSASISAALEGVQGGRVFLFLDQLERLLHPGRRAAHVIDLVQALTEIVERPPVELHVVLGIREDYLGRWRERVRGRRRLIDNWLRLGPLTVDEIADAVCEAAGKGRPPQTWSPDVMRRILVDVRMQGKAQEREARPLLDDQLDAAGEQEVEAAYAQIVCRALFETGKPPTQAEDARAQNILLAYQERTLSSLGALRNDALDLLERRLVNPDGSRNLLKADQAYSHLPHRTKEEVDEILRVLEDAAILRAQAQDRDQGHFYELGHDWLAEELDRQRRAREKRLVEEQEEVDRQRLAREKALAEELDRQRRARSKARLRRLWGIAGGALVLSVVGALALVARRRTEDLDHAQAQASAQKEVDVDALASAAKQKLMDDATLGKTQRSLRARERIASHEPILARLILLEEPTPETAEGWAEVAQAALRTDSPFAEVQGAQIAALSGDGEVMVSASAAHLIVRRVDHTRPPLLDLDAPSPIRAVAIDATGARVATISDDGHHLWSWRTQAPDSRKELPTPGPPLHTVAFDTDGAALIVSGAAGAWQVASDGSAGPHAFTQLQPGFSSAMFFGKGHDLVAALYGPAGPDPVPGLREAYVCGVGEGAGQCKGNGFHHLKKDDTVALVTAPHSWGVVFTYAYSDGRLGFVVHADPSGRSETQWLTREIVPQDIRSLQRAWNRDHPTAPVPEDGMYGPATEARLGDALELPISPPGIDALALSPDGSRLAASSRLNRTTHVWKAGGAAFAPRPVVLRVGGAVMFDTKGTRLVTLDGEGVGRAARIWILPGDPAAPAEDAAALAELSVSKLRERLASLTRACLSAEQRVSYLLETPEDAHRKFEECEARRGAAPAVDPCDKPPPFPSGAGRIQWGTGKNEWQARGMRAYLRDKFGNSAQGQAWSNAIEMTLAAEGSEVFDLTFKDVDTTAPICAWLQQCMKWKETCRPR